MNGTRDVMIIFGKQELDDETITNMGIEFRRKMSEIDTLIQDEVDEIKILGDPDFYYGLTDPGKKTY